jgi:hypothetical protein
MPTTPLINETAVREYVAMWVARFRDTLNKEYHDTRLNHALNQMEEHMANGICKRGQVVTSVEVLEDTRIDDLHELHGKG